MRIIKGSLLCFGWKKKKEKSYSKAVKINKGKDLLE